MARKLDSQFLKQFEDISVFGEKSSKDSHFGGSTGNEKSSLINNNDFPFKLPPPPSVSRHRPTIIRTSKSSENIVDLGNLKNASHAIVDRSRQLFESARNGAVPHGFGAMSNPGFLLESKKSRAAPGVPVVFTGAIKPRGGRGGGGQAATRPRKPTAPPRPPTKPGGPRSLHGNVAWHKSTNDIDLLSFDPLFEQAESPGSSTKRFEAMNVTNELADVFNKRLPNSASAFSIGQSEPASYRQNVEALDWSTDSGHHTSGSMTSSCPVAAPRKNSTSSITAGLSEPHAIALYDYESDASGDLNFQASDRIRLTKWVDADWLSGYNCRTWKEGIFPASYVDVRTPLPSSSSSSSSSPVHQPPKPPLLPPSGGLFSSPLPPPIPPGKAEIILRRKSSSGGGGGVSVAQRASMFSHSNNQHTPLPDNSPPPNKLFLPMTNSTPAAMARALAGSSLRDRPLPPPPLSPSGVPPSVQKARALYDYCSEAADDLEFAAGDTLVVTETIDSNWLRGRHDSALHRKDGMFPAGFVEMMGGGGGGGAGAAKRNSGGQGMAAIWSTASATGGDRSSSGGLGSGGGLAHIQNGAKLVQPAATVAAPAPAAISKRYWVLAVYDFPSTEPGDLSFKTGDAIHVTGSVNSDWLTGELTSQRQGQFPASFIRRANQGEVDGISRGRPQGRAIYDFPGESSDDLKLETGCIVYLLKSVDNDWYRGELESGATGIFPKSFIRVSVPLKS